MAWRLVQFLANCDAFEAIRTKPRLRVFVCSSLTVPTLLLILKSHVRVQKGGPDCRRRRYGGVDRWRLCGRGREGARRGLMDRRVVRQDAKMVPRQDY